MTEQFQIPNAVDLYETQKHMLVRGKWGDGVETVCAMSMFVKGAKNFDECVTAGWPRWLAELVARLFDAYVGAPDEQEASNEFLLSVAKAIQTPRDMEKALLQFLIRRLDTGEDSALKSLRSLEGDCSEQIEAVERVVPLLRRQLAGEDVSEEMAKARDAAYAAYGTSVYAAYAAAYAAVTDAAYAAYAAALAAVAAIADAADDAAAAVAAVVAYGAYAAVGVGAYAAARNDLIWALEHS